ncbi:MAG: FAD-binding oxidoreductase [Alphaproteobacteria bacterium]|nr:FAD-binding oxidoreductase [Alphaproteobacteria bacterium]MBU0803559.1 FAD-binding oxidoreductase [Alphaproteobacteria bacterium]MBU0873144.1 FAD-binding oxidoreductase [Alphaproteobacteria bacterium]MBU1402487.1 FAD-binding oxidoreductase [Alphaproteobacteria bacterium]MBU1593128.1 FAD-binding oxidoreductase [Alphaproteobacteria bacterium]
MTTRSSDILVIGGGMAGISAAALMAADASVTVLEAEANVGHHSTGRSAAIFIRNYGSPVLRKLNAASAPFLSAPDGVSDSSLLSPRGEMLVAAPDELEALAGYLEGSTGIEQLTPDQAVELVPILRRDRLAAAAIEWDAQDIDVDRMLQGFLRLLRKRGGEVVNGARTGALTRANGVWTATTDKGAYSAPIVVNAAGGWADKLAALADAPQVGLRPLRRSAALLPAPDGHDVTRWPLFASASERWYAKPEAGLLMVSPCDEDPVEPHDVWADDMVLAEGLDRYEQAVTVPVTHVLKNWAGMRSFVADRNPVVGFAPGAQGFFWLAGQGGYGIQASPALARLAADLCLGRTPDLPAETVAALDPGREIKAKAVANA